MSLEDDRAQARLAQAQKHLKRGDYIVPVGWSHTEIDQRRYHGMIISGHVVAMLTFGAPSLGQFWEERMTQFAQEKFFGVHRSAASLKAKNDSACTCNPCLADAGYPYTPIGAVPDRECQSCLPGWDGKQRCVLGCWSFRKQ